VSVLSVSVILPIFNGERYLDEQIRSIVSQISIGDELILINDASTDNSKSVIEPFLTLPNVKYIEKKSNCGLTSVINKGLKLARGDIIIFSDQDDVWLPGRVSRVRAEHAVADCVVVDALICNEDLQIVSHSYFGFVDFTLNPVAMFAKCRVLGCCMSFRRSLTSRLSIPERSWHDHFLIMYFILRGHNVVAVNVPLVMYRRHELALSRAGRSEHNRFQPFLFPTKLAKAAANRFYLLFSLVLALAT
jgi:glycosyltransferase involved in cell wall biosynthesis